MNSTTYFLNTPVDHSKAFVLATLCQQAYSCTDTSNVSALNTAIGGGNTWGYSTGTTYSPSWNVYNIPGNIKLVCFAGSTTLRQILAYCIQSGFMENPRMSYEAYINRFLNSHYADDIVPNLIPYITQGATAGNPNKVIICGHSLGSAFGSLLMSDLCWNYTPQITPLYFYGFGCPVVGSPRFNLYGFNTNQALGNPGPVGKTPMYAYSNGGDPVTHLPNRTFTIQRNYTTGGSLNLSSTRTVTYQTGQIGSEKYWIDNGSLRYQQNFDATPESSLARAGVEFLTHGTYPQDHGIDAYVRNLRRFIERSRLLGNSSNTAVAREIIYGVNQSLVSPHPAQTTLPNGSQPSQDSNALGGGTGAGNGPWTPPVTGGTRTMVPSVTIPSITVRQLPQWQNDKPHRARAMVGDGHAKLAMEQLREKIQHLRRHDGNVTNGIHRGSKWLIGNATAPEGLEAAVNLLEEYAGRMIS